MALAQVGIEEQRENIELIQNPYIELAFPVIGQSLPIDHGYQLYSAMKHKLMQLKDGDDLSIKTISGKLNPNKRNELNLTDRSKLLIRLPSEKVPFVYSFSGKSLIIGNHKIRLGIPKMNFLQPRSRLRSHIVVIRGYEEHLQGSEYELVNKHSGVKAIVDALKEKIVQDLSISNDAEENIG